MKRLMVLLLAVWLLCTACAAPVKEGPAAPVKESLVAPDGEVAYAICIADAQGQPVQDVMVQICDEGTCRVEQTDESGEVSFTSEPYPWEIHILMAPEGYVADAEVYTLPEQGGELTIVLQDAE